MTAPEDRNGMTGDDICLHCKCPKKWRNLSGDCDHLYWPDNLTDEVKRANGYSVPEPSAVSLSEEGMK
jgi:hypothetical protein